MNHTSDGSTADYYKLPEGATELQDLISHRNMNYSIGSIFCLVYDYSVAGSESIRIAREILRHAEHEVARLQGVQRS